MSMHESEEFRQGDRTLAADTGDTTGDAQPGTEVREIPDPPNIARVRADREDDRVTTFDPTDGVDVIAAGSDPANFASGEDSNAQRATQVHETIGEGKTPPAQGQR